MADIKPRLSYECPCGGRCEWLRTLSSSKWFWQCNDCGKRYPGRSAKKLGADLAALTAEWAVEVKRG